MDLHFEYTPFDCVIVTSAITYKGVFSVKPSAYIRVKKSLAFIVGMKFGDDDVDISSASE